MRAVRRGVSEDPPLEERIVHVLREAPDDDATPETIQGLLAREEGIRPAEEDVRDKTRELVDEGRVEEVASTGEGRRFRLVDADY